MRGLSLILLASAGLFAQSSLQHAEELYQRTDYRESLDALKGMRAPDGQIYFLEGRDYFMLTEYRKASEAFERALAAEPANSEYAHWLGRAFGRRAETSGPLTAPMYASKARQYFEKAVALDANNGEALNDLFDYYLQAPGILGGGYDKAAQVAQRIAAHNEAEGHFAQAQLADKRRQFDTAAEQLRKAMELAPRQAGRALDLARYLAKHGRIQESEAAFDHAERLAPDNPVVSFARARVYVEQKRNLEKAKELLHKYLQCDLTPDDPPRDQAEKLLRQASGV